MPFVLGSYVEPDNSDRAGWALLALRAYAKATRHGPNDQVIEGDNAEEIISDFLGDLRHLIDQLELESSFDGLSERGDFHYVAEVEEEGECSDCCSVPDCDTCDPCKEHGSDDD